MSRDQEGAVSLRIAVTDDDHTRGSSSAPVTLVEYGDYQCPHCAHAHPIVKELQSRLGVRLRFVFRHFPLTESHPQALHAAEAAESVAALGGIDAFWKMHDTIFTHAQESRTALSDRHLVQFATQCGVDGAKVQEELDGNVHEERVRADFMGGVRSGVNGTPTFFVNGTRFDGDSGNVDAFADALERSAGVAQR